MRRKFFSLALCVSYHIHLPCGNLTPKTPQQMISTSQYMLSYLRRLLPLLTIVPVSTMATPWPLLLFICIVSADQKVWQWSNDFDNPSHWMEGRSPCPGQDVKIPAEIVFMPRERVLGQLNFAVG